MARFDCFDAPLAGLKVIRRKPIEDVRGFLSRFYCAEEFKAFGFNKSISQINHTLTRNKGAVRGLHFQQSPHAEIKLVSCLKGEVFDVAVDLRNNSTTFLHWHGEVLSEKNQRSLLIPEGFAHGFVTLTDDVEVNYQVSQFYTPGKEKGIRWNDPAFGIKWLINNPIISEKDAIHPDFIA